MWDCKLIWMVPPSQDRGAIEAWEQQVAGIGKDGWEVVSVISQRGLWGVIFKRPRKA